MNTSPTPLSSCKIDFHQFPIVELFLEGAREQGFRLSQSTIFHDFHYIFFFFFHSPRLRYARDSGLESLGSLSSVLSFYPLSPPCSSFFFFPISSSPPSERSRSSENNPLSFNAGGVVLPTGYLRRSSRTVLCQPTATMLSVSALDTQRRFTLRLCPTSSRCKIYNAREIYRLTCTRQGGERGFQTSIYS